MPLQFAINDIIGVLTSAHGNMYAVIKAVLASMKVWTWDLFAPLDASSRSGSRSDPTCCSTHSGHKSQIPLIKGGLDESICCSDIGGTSIKYGLADAKGQLLETHEMPTEAQKGGPHILNTTKEIVARYLKKHPLAGVAISSAGMVDPDKGEIFYAGPQIPNYAGTQFKKEIEETFQIPCEIENDVNCAGLAEVTTGHAKGSNNAVCLTIADRGSAVASCSMVRSFMALAIQPVRLAIFICQMVPFRI